MAVPFAPVPFAAIVEGKRYFARRYRRTLVATSPLTRSESQLLPTLRQGLLLELVLSSVAMPAVGDKSCQPFVSMVPT